MAVETNRYPVPFDWVGKKLEVQILAEEVAIFGGEDPVRHRGLEGKHQVLWWKSSRRRRLLRGLTGLSGERRGGRSSAAHRDTPGASS